MTMNLLYLVGPPGVGKSSAMAALTAQCKRVPRTGPVAYDTLYREYPPPEASRELAVEIGRRRETYSGTDALGMAVNPAAVEWIYSSPHGLVLAEGARLANMRFFSAAMHAAYNVHLIHLGAPDSLLADRRSARGSDQNPAWVKGATTRAERIAADVSQYSDTQHLWTDGLSPEDVAAWLFDRYDWLSELR